MKGVPGGDSLVKDVQCYELFGGIALKNQAFSFFIFSVNGQIYSNTFHARYSRAPPTSTREAVRPSTKARKEAKGIRSDARHPPNFHASLQQYCVKVLQRNNVLKALAGSTCGSDKEAMLTTSLA